MINLKVVSPQKVIFEKEVEMAVLPGAEGDFAAMPNHSPFISSLRPGQMAIMSSNKVDESFFVSGGLVMLKDNLKELGPKKPSDIKKAQQNIINVCRKLEKEDKILISGRKDNYV